MLKNIELKMNEIKYICKKHELNMDHFLIEVNRQFNLEQAKNAGNREKRNGTPIGLLFGIAVALPLFCSNSVYSFFNSQYTKMITCGAIPFYRFFQDSLLIGVKSYISLMVRSSTQIIFRNLKQLSRS